MAFPEFIPETVPFEGIPDVYDIEDTDTSTNPEAYVLSQDHTGVESALEILTPRLREILCRKTGLNETGEPQKSAEIAEFFDLSLETVSSALTRARNRLRANGNILSIINGEYIPASNGKDNSLQTS